MTSPHSHESGSVRDWSSSCCAAAMTTAGGDGTHGSTCWAECRKCGQPCDPAEPAPTSGQEHAPEDGR